MGCSSSIQRQNSGDERNNRRQLRAQSSTALHSNAICDIKHCDDATDDGSSVVKTRDGAKTPITIHVEANGVIAQPSQPSNRPQGEQGLSRASDHGSDRLAVSPQGKKGNADLDGFSEFSEDFEEMELPSQAGHPAGMDGGAEAAMNRRVSNLGHEYQAMGKAMAWSESNQTSQASVPGDIQSRRRRASTVNKPPSGSLSLGSLVHPENTRRARHSVNHVLPEIFGPPCRLVRASKTESSDIGSEPHESFDGRVPSVTAAATSTSTSVTSGRDGVETPGSMLVHRGVSVRWLMRFFETCKKDNFGGRRDFTTQDVMDRVIGPACAGHAGAPYVIAALVDISPAETYVSHSWNRPFAELVQCAHDTLGRDPNSTVWIDIFALPQAHKENQIMHRSIQEQIARRLQVIRAVDSVLLVMDADGSALNQVWVQIEAHQAGKAGNLEICPSLLEKGSGLRIGSCLREIDIIKSKSPRQGHSDAARRMVLDKLGSSEEFNKSTRRFILQAMSEMVSTSRKQETGLPPVRVAEISGVAESVLHLNDDLAGAVELMEETLGYLETALGAHHARVVKAIGNLISAQVQLERPHAALPLNHRAISIAEEKHGHGSRQACRAHVSLGTTLFALGSYAEAAAAYRTALKGELDTFKDELPAILGLSEALRASGDTDAAGYVLQSALHTAEHGAVGNSKEDKLDVTVTLLKTMGEHCKAEEKLDSAEEYYGRAVATLQAKSRLSDTADVVNLELASTLNSLAGICRLNGNLDKAYTLYRKSLTLREVILPDGHPSIASSVLHLAAVLRTQGRYEKAAEAYLESLATLKKIRGPVHLDIAALYVSLASCQKELPGKTAEAKTLYQNAISIRSLLLGPEHPDTAKVQSLLDNMEQSEHQPADDDILRSEDQ